MAPERDVIGLKSCIAEAENVLDEGVKKVRDLIGIVGIKNFPFQVYFIFLFGVGMSKLNNDMHCSGGASLKFH